MAASIDPKNETFNQSYSKDEMEELNYVMGNYHRRTEHFTK